MSDQTIINTPTILEQNLEALLFVAESSISPVQLAEVFGVKQAEIEQGLKQLEARYELGSGLRLQWHNGRVQLTTAPEMATAVERFLGLEATAHLSRAALETIAIVAYRQPITRPGIDAIRGVNSDGVIKSLLSKGMIQEVGRAESPGRPILYGTTSDFLQQFGLKSITELPPFEDVQPEEIEISDNGLLKD
jgi:segregation and condensation protein B